jgi:hypothetical protein
MSPCRYGNDIIKQFVFKKFVEMSEEIHDVSVPCTHPELKNIIDCAVQHLKPEKSKRQYEKCYSDFEADVTRRM